MPGDWLATISEDYSVSICMVVQEDLTWNILMMVTESSLTFRHRAFSIKDRRFPTLQRTLFIYLINKYIPLFDICLTVHH